jgi:methylmalonyl-CoA mutase
MPDAPDLTADELVLAADFPAVTRRGWQRLVARVLHSPDDATDPERELATLTLDGIEIAPLYTADDETGEPGYPGQAPFVRGRTAVTGWAGTSGASTLTRRPRSPGSRS